MGDSDSSRDELLVEPDDGIYRELFLRSLDAILVVDADDGRILLASPAADRVLSPDGHCLVGTSFSDLFPPRDDSSGLDLLSQLEVYDGVITQDFLDAKGDRRPIDMSLTMFEDEDRNLIAFTLRDVRERVQAKQDRERLVRELETALAEVRTLSGLLPICSGCKRIREDSGYWRQIESYIRDHSDAEFSHGFCPDCAKQYFPGLVGTDGE